MEFQCPPDDLAAEGIEHNRQISELLGKVQIGDVCDPKLVNPCQFHPPSQVWTTRQLCLESVVRGTNGRLRKHKRLSSPIKRNTRLWFACQPSRLEERQSGDIHNADSPRPAFG